MKFIDEFLNRFTMYRCVLYGLLILCAVSLFYAIFGFIRFEPFSLFSSFALIVSSAYLSNKLFAYILKVPNNPESSFITGLILFLILTPISSLDSVWVYIFTPVVAIASKYVIKLHIRHIFNPAAFALVIIGLMGAYQAEWWVGSKVMFPWVLIIGLLIVRKVRRFQMFLTFIFVSLITVLVMAFVDKENLVMLIPQLAFSWPILFLGTIMLTEPFTTPPSKKNQMIYAAIVGFFSGFHFSIGPLFSTCELALVIGNLFSYIVSFRKRIELTFKEKVQISETVFEFIFSPNSKFSFSPGQYLEWTLGHKKIDSRGIRRYFTIASSPTENDLRLGIKIDKDKGSSFKRALLNLKPGDKIYAGQLSGDFTLPKQAGKYVFIAGGIGITPFRSIIKNAIDNKKNLDVILFYSCSEEGEFVYQDLLRSAEKIGLKTIFVCSHPKPGWKGLTGRINSDLIKKEVDDYKDRIYYLSGPDVMVDAYKSLLRNLGIRPDKIVTDYFPGY